MKNEKNEKIMYSNNFKKFNSLIFVFLLIISSCNDDPISSNIKNLIGFYKATTFIEPGSRDGGVDILANGGELTAQFTENHTVSGHLFIPDSIDSNYPPMDTNYCGTYTLVKDTLRFKNTSNVLEIPNIYFIVKNDLLESGDIIGRHNPFKIILTKQ